MKIRSQFYVENYETEAFGWIHIIARQRIHPSFLEPLKEAFENICRQYGAQKAICVQLLSPQAISDLKNHDIEVQLTEHQTWIPDVIELINHYQNQWINSINYPEVYLVNTALWRRLHESFLPEEKESELIKSLGQVVIETAIREGMHYALTCIHSHSPSPEKTEPSAQASEAQNPPDNHTHTSANSAVQDESKTDESPC